MNTREVEMMLEDESKKNNWVSILIRYYPEKVDSVRPHMLELTSQYPHMKDSFMIKCFMNGIRTLNDVPKCDYCKTARCSVMKMGNKFDTTCSKECRSKKRLKNTTKTNMAKHGVEHTFSRKDVKEKIENSLGGLNPQQIESVRKKTQTTMIERYGVTNISQSEEHRKKAQTTLMNNYGVLIPAFSEEIKEKTKATNENRYGGPAPQSCKYVRSKIDQTNEVRYGGRSPSSSKDVTEKIAKTNYEKYGRGNPQQRHLSIETVEILSSSERLVSMYDEYGDTKEMADVLGCDTSTITDYLRKYDNPAKRKMVSYEENKVAEFIESLGFETIRSDRSILTPYESDIVVPEKNLIVEYNGIYWHSEEHKPKKYHQDKSLTAHSKGFELVHVWEDDWMDDHKRQIIKDKLKSKLGISDQKVFARKTTIKEPSKEEVRSLMENHHIQGFVGYSQAFGLYEGDSLVACMTLRKTKEEGVYDLNRYASSKTVVGGMSKLLSHVKKNFPFKEIYTYAHLDYSSGSVYEKSGFERKHITPAGLWYVKRGETVRLRRERFMKHKLPRILGLGVDMNKTESEIMADHGYYRVFDAGSIKYSLTP